MDKACQKGSRRCFQCHLSAHRHEGGGLPVCDARSSSFKKFSPYPGEEEMEARVKEEKGSGEKE